MRIAALIIGIFGAVAAFIGALLAILIGSIAGAFGESDGDQVAVLGTVALLMSIVGLIGASLAIAKPRLAAILMVLSAVIGLVLVFVVYIVATVLLLIAALLAFLGRSRSET